mgnify:CR=1 FL=1
MMKFILLTALIYQPLSANYGSPDTSVQQDGLELASNLVVGTNPLSDLNQLEAEIADELDRQLKAMHAELPQQSSEQELLANQSR